MQFSVLLEKLSWTCPSNPRKEKMRLNLVVKLQKKSMEKQKNRNYLNEVFDRLIKLNVDDDRRTCSRVSCKLCVTSASAVFDGDA